MFTTIRRSRRLALFAVACTGTTFLTPGFTPFGTTAAQAEETPEWLATVNAYRNASGLPSVRVDAAMQDGVNKHAKYLAITGSLAHDEDPSHPLYTPAGAEAARASLLGGMTAGGEQTDRQIVEGWMTAPFHASHILEPRFERTAFASLRDEPNAILGVAGVLNTGGRGKKQQRTQPILFPGRDATIPMTSFVAETPDPLTHCPGYVAPAGLPVFVMFASSPSAARASISTNGAPLDACIIDRNYNNPNAGLQSGMRSHIDGKNMLIVVPKSPLTAGSTYDVVVDGGTAGTVSWKFSVGAADSPLPAAVIPSLLALTSDPAGVSANAAKPDGKDVPKAKAKRGAKSLKKPAPRSVAKAKVGKAKSSQ
jgi:uncharacterized protein YkwD